MGTKETNNKDIIRSTAILFLTYTTLITFIFSLIVFWVKHALSEIHNDLLTICLSLISAILIYHLLHFACKSSSIEFLRKSKLDKSGSEKFLKRMNLVFVLCIIVSIVYCMAYIVLDRIIIVQKINEIYDTYSPYSTQLTNSMIKHIETEYNFSVFSKLYTTLIIEISLVVSFISLVPYQKKILEKYNK